MIVMYAVAEALFGFCCLINKMEAIRHNEVKENERVSKFHLYHLSYSTYEAFVCWNRYYWSFQKYIYEDLSKLEHRWKSVHILTLNAIRDV